MVDLAQTLIVPVDLAALCVGDTDVNGSAKNPYGTKDFARLTPDFSLLPYAAGGVAHNRGPYLSTQVLPDTFQQASTPLDVGIHLHWSLPDALTHGAQGLDGSIGFPKAANRWLVVRIVTNSADPKAPTTALKAWVLESDRLWNAPPGAGDPPQNGRSLAIPIAPDPNTQPNISWMMLGRVFDYDGWAEDPTAQRADLTALGYGEATYAATYQLCPNVFGFWDTMTDLDPAVYPPASSRVSYMIMGWHADAADDPLVRIRYPLGATYAEKLATIAADYQWSFVPDAAETVPQRTLYNSVLTDIPWDRKTHYIDKRTAAPGTLDVAVGNTTPEALSAMLAAQPDLSGEPNIELILNALQLGLLSRLQLPGGMRTIDEAIHQAGFASTSSGTIWTITPTTAGSQQSVDVGGGASLQTAPAVLSQLPPAIGDALNALNDTQAQVDSLDRAIESMRNRIFADWCRYMQIEYATLLPVSITILANDARTYILSEVAALDQMSTQSGDLKADVDRQQVALQQLLGDSYTLSTTDGPRFWNPTDPVLLFFGEDVRPASRYNPTEACDEAGNLICRLGGTLISALIAKAGTAELTLLASGLPQLSPNAAMPVTGGVPALLGEAFFLDPVQAPVLAAAIAAMGGADNPAVADFAAFVADITAAQVALFTGTATTTVSFAGMPPRKVSFKPWSAPWIPILLQWSSEHFPNAMPPYPSDFITSHYVLDDEAIDLTFTGSIPVDVSTLRTYDGTIVLAQNTEINIRQQIEEFIANFPDAEIDAELKEILAKMKLPALAQSLSGFNESFLMLARILQMEVSDPLGILQGLLFANFTNITVKTAVGRQNVDSPLFNNTFAPLRTGGFRIPKVWIIDTFGQCLVIDAPTVIRAENLIPPEETEPLINLPARVTQPVQLSFRWISASNDAIEMNSLPATTPVFGWVLFNHLDQALMIYDGQGNALGSFNLLGPFWQGAPGNQQTYNQPIATVFADANPHLRNFALGFSSAADPVGYLSEMLQTLNRSLGFIATGHDQASDNLAVLIGRPVALARVALDLETMGLPAIDQSKAAFKAAIDAGDPVARETGNAQFVKFPVRLGDLSDIDDGLIGYFIDDGGESAYRTFYSPAADPNDQHGVVLPAYDTITLATDADSAPVYLSLFVDPDAAIHATTGIVPIKALTIPPSLISDDLARLAVTFLTTPVINGGTAQMPVPDESGYRWGWVTQIQGAGQWSVTPVLGGQDLSLLPQQIQEGWLELQRLPDSMKIPSQPKK